MLRAHAVVPKTISTRAMGPYTHVHVCLQRGVYTRNKCGGVVVVVAMVSTRGGRAEYFDLSMQRCHISLPPPGPTTFVCAYVM